jgi:hypothetical protein
VSRGRGNPSCARCAHALSFHYGSKRKRCAVPGCQCLRFHSGPWHWPYEKIDHDPSAFRPGTAGSEGWCRYNWFCGERAVCDTFDSLGRRVPLCITHATESPVFASVWLYEDPCPGCEAVERDA